MSYRNKRVTLLAATVLVLLCGVEAAQACTCAVGKVEPCQAYGTASAVFVGSVAGVERRKPGSVEEERRREDAGEYQPPVVFRFAVEETFGGGTGAAREVEVRTGEGGGDCGYHFERGVGYLVYAHRSGRTGDLVTGICAPTKPLAQASAEELKFLRGLSSRAPGATLTIAVTMREYFAHASGAPPDPDERVADLPLSVEGEGARHELRTDAAGRQQLAGLKAGTYTVRVELPEELHTHRAEEKVTIAERGCGGVSFYVAHNGRVSGRAVDAEGRPAARIIVNALPAGEADKESPNLRYAETDDEGNFKFEALPAGSYLLGVRLNRFPAQKDPTNAFPRTYYPGVKSASDATPVIVGEGEHVKDFTLRLPTRRALRTLAGAVVWADGRPVAHANVSYRETTYRDEEGLTSGLRADEQGRFTLETYDGLSYVFGALSNEPYAPGSPERAERVRVTVGQNSDKVRIVIRPPGGQKGAAARP